MPGTRKCEAITGMYALRCSGLHACYTDAPRECPIFPGEVGQSAHLCRDGDGLLQLLLLKAGHQLALIVSLPFVHTACRSYRLSGGELFGPAVASSHGAAQPEIQ